MNIKMIKLIFINSIYRITKGESYSDDLSTVFVTAVGILSAFSTTDCAFAVVLLWPDWGGL